MLSIDIKKLKKHALNFASRVKRDRYILRVKRKGKGNRVVQNIYD